MISCYVCDSKHVLLVFESSRMGTHQLSWQAGMIASRWLGDQGVMHHKHCVSNSSLKASQLQMLTLQLASVSIPLINTASVTLRRT